MKKSLKSIFSSGLFVLLSIYYPNFLKAEETETLGFKLQETFNSKDKQALLNLFSDKLVKSVDKEYETFVKAFPNRIINLHPSLLPKYKGLHAIEQALESGDTKTGCTVHYVNDELDSGEVIMQLEVPIEPDDTVETLTPRIQRQEYAILPAAIKQVKQRIPVAIN